MCLFNFAHHNMLLMLLIIKIILMGLTLLPSLSPVSEKKHLMCLLIYFAITVLTFKLLNCRIVVFKRKSLKLFLSRWKPLLRIIVLVRGYTQSCQQFTNKSHNLKLKILTFLKVFYLLSKVTVF